MNKPNGRFIYIYVLKDPRADLVRYVGWTISPKRRLAEHIKVAKNGSEINHRTNWIKSLLDCGIEPSMEVVESGLLDFSEREKWWIRHYRSMGVKLTNGTDGGEGLLGHIKSASTRKKLSEAFKNRPNPRIGLKHSAASKAKMSLARFGKHPTAKTRKKLSAAMKGRKITKRSRHISVQTLHRNLSLDQNSVRNKLLRIGNIGRWKLIKRLEGSPGRWKCLCSCGTKRIVREANLARSGSMSCGCLSREKTSKRLTRHGEGGRRKLTPEYRAWCAIISGCNTPSSCKWKSCGARGIIVCRAWRKSFSKFLENVGRRPSSKHCLIRINKNQDFRPGNVIWEIREKWASVAS